MHLAPNHKCCAVFRTRPEPSHKVHVRLDSLLRVFVLGRLGFSPSGTCSCWIHSSGFRLRGRVPAGFTPGLAGGR